MTREMDEYLAELEMDREMRKARADHFGTDRKTSRSKPGGIDIGYGSFDGTDGSTYGGCRWVRMPKGNE